MIEEYRLLPECEADTLLIHLLGYKNPNHAANAGDVSNTMQQKYKNRVAIGVIDKLKRKSDYFEGFNDVKQSEKCGLLRKHNIGTQHHYIYIQKGLEVFLLESAQVARLNPVDYGLPTTPKDLGKITKRVNVFENQELKRFINDLVQRKPENIVLLKTWIEEILKNPKG